MYHRIEDVRKETETYDTWLNLPPHAHSHSIMFDQSGLRHRLDYTTRQTDGQVALLNSYFSILCAKNKTSKTGTEGKKKDETLSSSPPSFLHSFVHFSISLPQKALAIAHLLNQ